MRQCAPKLHQHFGVEVWCKVLMIDHSSIFHKISRTKLHLFFPHLGFVKAGSISYRVTFGFTYGNISFTTS